VNKVELIAAVDENRLDIASLQAREHYQLAKSVFQVNKAFCGVSTGNPPNLDMEKSFFTS